MTARVGIPLQVVTLKVGDCRKCGGCCTDVAVPINPPRSTKDHDEIIWYLYHRGVSVEFDDDGWRVAFDARCENLEGEASLAGCSSGVTCTAYAERPFVCSEYSPKTCIANDDRRRVFWSARDYLTWLSARRPVAWSKLQATGRVRPQDMPNTMMSK